MTPVLPLARKLFYQITSKIKGYSFEVLKPDGLDVKGAVLSDQIKSLDWRTRQAKFIGKLSAQAYGKVLRKVNLFFLLLDAFKVYCKFFNIKLTFIC